jgi:hypothetical protein
VHNNNQPPRLQQLNQMHSLRVVLPFAECHPRHSRSRHAPRTRAPQSSEATIFHSLATRMGTSRQINQVSAALPGPRPAPHRPHCSNPSTSSRSCLPSSPSGKLRALLRRNVATQQTLPRPQRLIQRMLKQLQP